MSADEMANRIVIGFERGLTTTVNDIEHIESQTLRGHVGRQGVLPAGREDRSGDRADHRDLAVVAAPAAAGHDSAVHHHLQRLDGADPAARAVGQRPVRAAALRPRRELHPRAAGDGAGRVDPEPVRRQAARRSRWTSIRTRCRPRGCSPTDVVNAIAAQNLILPGGTSKIGGIEYDVRLQRQPRHGRGAERPADQDVGRRRRSTSATSPTCATATRRRPTSSASTASARRMLTVIRRPAPPRRSTSSTASRRRCRASPPACRRSSRSSSCADQSVFVRAAIEGVVREAVIAGCLPRS